MDTPPAVVETKLLEPTREQNRGRLILAIALGVWFFVALCIDTLVLVLGNIQSPLIICARLAITVALFYAIWIGQRWARWLMLAFCIYAFLSALRHFIVHRSPFLLFNMILFLGICLMFIFVLGISKHVAAFLDYQRTRRAALLGH